MRHRVNDSSIVLARADDAALAHEVRRRLTDGLMRQLLLLPLRGQTCAIPPSTNNSVPVT